MFGKIFEWLNPLTWLSIPILAIICFFASIGLFIFGRSLFHHLKKMRRTPVRIAEIFACAVCAIILIVCVPTTWQKYQDQQTYSAEQKTQAAEKEAAKVKEQTTST